MAELPSTMENLSLAEGKNAGGGFSWEDVKDDIPQKYITNAERVLGWTEGPTEIQVQVLKKIVSNEDANSEKNIVAQAQLGSGKSGMFGFAVLRKLDLNKGLQAVIFCDTRELATQTAEDLSKLAGDDVRVWVCVKEKVGKIRNEVKDGAPHIIVGTVGSLNHNMVKRRRFKREDIDLIVVDEADTILIKSEKNKGTFNQIKKITDSIKKKNPKSKIILVSATIPDDSSQKQKDKEVLTGFKTIIGKNFDSVRTVTTKDLAGDYIKKYKVKCNDFKDKMEVLVELYGIQAETKDLGQCIVFCNSHPSLNELDRFVKKSEKMKDTKVLVLHGRLKGDERDKVVQEFRQGQHKICMCTDVLSKGFNLPEVSVVINFEVAYKQKTHLHRMGRCGRIGQDRVHQNGVCITLLGNGTSPIQAQRGIRPDPNYDVNMLKKIEVGLNEAVKSKSVDRRNIEEISKVFEDAQRAGTNRE